MRLTFNIELVMKTRKKIYLLTNIQRVFWVSVVLHVNPNDSSRLDCRAAVISLLTAAPLGLQSSFFSVRNFSYRFMSSVISWQLPRWQFISGFIFVCFPGDSRRHLFFSIFSEPTRNLPPQHFVTMLSIFWEILAARFGMYRHRLLQVNVHLTAFFEICDMIQLKFQQLENVGRFCKRFANFAGM